MTTPHLLVYDNPPVGRQTGRTLTSSICSMGAVVVAASMVLLESLLEALLVVLLEALLVVLLEALLEALLVVVLGSSSLRTRFIALLKSN